MELGTRIYYTGDRANHEDAGTIVGINPATKYGPVSYDIDLDDGRELRGLYPSAFGKGPGRRFWALDEWQADRARRIAEMVARLAE